MLRINEQEKKEMERKFNTEKEEMERKFNFEKEEIKAKAEQGKNL